MAKYNLRHFFLFFKKIICIFATELKCVIIWNLKNLNLKISQHFHTFFWHWLAYNYTAKKLGVWKFKYLLHDIEKPWLKLFWGDYTKVRKWHRENNKHHITYKDKSKIDWEAVCLDWEASPLTKYDSPRNARQTYEWFITERFANGTISEEMKSLLEENIPPILEKLGL